MYGTITVILKDDTRHVGYRLEKPNCDSVWLYPATNGVECMSIPLYNIRAIMLGQLYLTVF